MVEYIELLSDIEYGIAHNSGRRRLCYQKRGGYSMENAEHTTFVIILRVWFKIVSRSVLNGTFVQSSLCSQPSSKRK